MALLRFFILFLLFMLAWILLRQLLVLFHILKKPGSHPSRKNGVPYQNGTVKKPTVEYTDVRDAKFTEIPTQTNQQKQDDSNE